MIKNIKYRVFVLVMVLVLVTASNVLADNDDRRGSSDDMMRSQAVQVQNRMQKEGENQEEEREREREQERNGLKVLKEENRVQIQSLLDSVKEKREEFRNKFEQDKKEVKAKIEEMRNKFRESLGNIKDEKKQFSAEKIVDLIASLNIRTTDILSDKVNQIENVLVGIESRITKAEERGLDVSVVKADVELAKIAIQSARDAISAQIDKIYTTEVTDETTLRDEMKKLRDLFSTDIKAVREKVKQAHEAVRVTAVALAQVPHVDDDEDEEEDITSSVEDNSNQ